MSDICPEGTFEVASMYLSGMLGVPPRSFFSSFPGSIKLSELPDSLFPPWSKISRFSLKMGMFVFVFVFDFDDFVFVVYHFLRGIAIGSYFLICVFGWFLLVCCLNF